MTQRFDTMACTEVLEQLEAYVDGELDGAGAASIEAHLEACPACAAEHRLAAAVRRELRALPELDATPAVLREIAWETQRARFGAPVRRRAWMGLAAALAAVALGASLWWGALRQAPPTEPPPAGVPEAGNPAAVARATAEARYALAYLNRIHRRAGLKLRDDLFVDRLARPATRGLARSLAPGVEPGAENEDNGPDRS